MLVTPIRATDTLSSSGCCQLLAYDDCLMLVTIELLVDFDRVLFVGLAPRLGRHRLFDYTLYDANMLYKVGDVKLFFEISLRCEEDAYFSTPSTDEEWAELLQIKFVEIAAVPLDFP